MKKNIIIAILSVLVVSLGGYLVYEKTSTEELKDEQKENKVVEEEKESWINYLLKQDIKEITINYCSNKDESTSLKNYKLTKEELKKILAPLKEEKLIKSLQGSMGGYGCVCCSSIEVDYETNKGKYHLIFNNNDIKTGIVVRNNDNKTNNALIADVDLLEIMENNNTIIIEKEDTSIEENLQIRWLYETDIFDLNNQNPIHEIVKNK